MEHVEAWKQEHVETPNVLWEVRESSVSVSDRS